MLIQCFEKRITQRLICCRQLLRLEGRLLSFSSATNVCCSVNNPYSDRILKSKQHEAGSEIPNVHQSISGRSRFYKNVDVAPVPADELKRVKLGVSPEEPMVNHSCGFVKYTSYHILAYFSCHPNLSTKYY